MYLMSDPNINNNNNSNVHHDGEDLIPVTWSGKGIYLRRSDLDEWHEESFEDRVYFVEKNPWTQRIPLHQLPGLNNNSNNNNMESTSIATLDVDDDGKAIDSNPPNSAVVVHWSGKTLLLPRDHLEAWFNSSFELRCDFVKRHPSVEMKS
jgi:hypothetical protein